MFAKLLRLNFEIKLHSLVKRMVGVFFAVFAISPLAEAQDGAYSAPPVSIASMIPSETGDALSLEVAEEGGDVYQLQTLDSLNSTSGWQTIATFTDAFVDVSMLAGEGQRFYRVILDPLANFESTDTPETVGLKLVDNLLAREGYVPNGDDIHYSEWMTGSGAFDFVNLTDNQLKYEGLLARYAFCMDYPDDPRFGTSSFGKFMVSQTVLPMYNYNHDPVYWQRALELAMPQVDRWIDRPNTPRYWGDDLYFPPGINSQFYRLTGNTDHTTYATTRLTTHLDVLQMPNGLIKHTKGVPFVWGRGAGWVASGLTRTLMALPLDHPDREAIMTAYLNLMAGLLPFQTDSGRWLQVIDYPPESPNWEESSSTAMFTFAMATGLRYGWLDVETYGPVVRKAWRGLIANIDADGNLDGTCCGTNEKQSVQDYFKRATWSYNGDMHGQGPMLWAANALILYQRSIGLPVINFTDPTPSTLSKGYSDVRVTVDAFGQEDTIASIDLYFGGTYLGQQTEVPYVWHNDDYPALLGKVSGNYELLAIATGTNGVSTMITNVVTVTAASSTLIAAWDFDGDAADTAQLTDGSFMTPFAFVSDSTTMASSTVGGLTLTQANAWTELSYSPANSPVDRTATPIAELQTAQEMNCFNDGVLLDENSASMTLSGLTIGQAYRIQFMGVGWSQPGGTTIINITLAASGGATGSADLYEGGVPPDRAAEFVRQGAYSQYLDFTPTASSITLTATESSGTKKTITGLAIEAIDP